MSLTTEWQQIRPWASVLCKQNCMDATQASPHGQQQLPCKRQTHEWQWPHCKWSNRTGGIQWQLTMWKNTEFGRDHTIHTYPSIHCQDLPRLHLWAQTFFSNYSISFSKTQCFQLILFPYHFCDTIGPGNVFFSFSPQVWKPYDFFLSFSLSFSPSVFWAAR